MFDKDFFFQILCPVHVIRWVVLNLEIQSAFLQPGFRRGVGTEIRDLLLY